jgi:hypothetical protein
MEHSEPNLGERTAALKACLDSKPGAVADARTAAKGSTPLVLIYKVMGKMFAILSVRGGEDVIQREPRRRRASRRNRALGRPFLRIGVRRPHP